MSIFDNQEKPFEFIKSQPSNIGSVQNFKKITVGAGNEKFEVSDQGLFMGAETYADAPVKIPFTGKFCFGDKAGGKYIEWDGTDLNVVGIPLTISDISDAGSLAGLDTVGATNCDTTIISGGKIITGLLTADNIQAGTLTGRTVQTTSLTTGANVRISNGNYIEFLYDNSQKVYLYVDSSGNGLFDFDGNFFINTNNGMMVTYNEDGGSDSCIWQDDDALAMAIDSAKDLTVADDIYADNYYDYAEFFESTDDFKSGIPVGTTVVLEGDKVRPALTGEIPFGTVSGSAAIILNGGSSDAGTSWGKKYLTDDYGQKIYEEVERWYLPRKPRFKGEKKSGYVKNGKVPKGATIKKKMVQKINPDWDPKKEFVHRKKRPEWNKIGLLGRVRITKGQPINPNWIKLKNISDNVEEWLIK